MSNTFEILARGLCYDGKWREGDLCHHRDGSVTIRPIGSTDGLGYYVKRETVTPYVQRTDKNGKKVFLFDVVRMKGVCANSGEPYDELWYVGYNYEKNIFCINGKSYEEFPSQEEFLEECEVVGSLFDEDTKFLYETVQTCRRAEVAR